MDLQKLEAVLQSQNQPKFRTEQLKKAIYQEGISNFSDISTISKDLRGILDEKLDLLSFEARQILISKDGQSIKALLKLRDGSLTETVLIAPKPGSWSACISCQVGCAVGCKFCATGKLGLKRNLTAEEITDQVLFWLQYLKNNPEAGIRNSKLTNIVYMGMGEPFLNWEQVGRSLRELTDPELFGFGARSISVSTSGIPEGIGRLATEFPQVNLALSLHFGDDEKRSLAMPINRKNNLGKLREALQDYFTKTKRKVFLEYVMLSGVNDSREDADKLIRFVKSIGKLQLLHVNLIRYNSTGSEFKPSSKERTVEFRDYLTQNRIDVTIRKSLGEEIQGACGQLAGK
ncbi:MAG: 23S rRNA (adenine(2503)-C(2))-methyltransferase RlmN [Candidatus Moranbacteria bacterium]|nr:23S rRNA (adenine(2503)-C(2))-methyltransferase RlmN [Candidatus Moranbacteria bacterium]